MPIVLKYLLLLRAVVMVGQLAALIALDRAFGVAVPWLPVLVVLGILGGVTLAAWLRLGRLPAIPAPHFVGQLLADILALSALVFFTGGSLNPFISLFLLPIIFAAAALPSTHIAIVAGAAALAYTGLMFVHHPVEHVGTLVRGFDLHLWGMWYGFLLSAACVAAFVARIAGALRERDTALAEAREHALRNERVVALGTLAAGTAHELGTPLATMSIVAQDLAADLEHQPALRGSVQVLLDQLGRCKATLGQLALDAGESRAEEGFRCNVADFVREVVADCRALNPGAQLAVEEVSEGPCPQIVPDRTLRQALLNLLNNAAEASPHTVTIHARWDGQQLGLAVVDRGPGIAREVRRQLGTTPVSSKQGAGLGLGVYLAVTTLERLGGKVDFQSREGGGTRTSIELPLAGLRLDAP